MAIGFGVLRLSPRDFWAMTPREFERAAGAVLPRRGRAPSRGELAALMSAFPDERKKNDHG